MPARGWPQVSGARRRPNKRKRTHRERVDHGGCRSRVSRGELHALVDELVVHADEFRVAQLVLALERRRPVLEPREDLFLDVAVHGPSRLYTAREQLEVGRDAALERRLCKLGEERGAAVLDAYVAQVECEELDVGVVVLDAAEEGARGVRGEDRGGSDEVCELEGGDEVERGLGWEEVARRLVCVSVCRWSASPARRG